MTYNLVIHADPWCSSCPKSLKLGLIVNLESMWVSFHHLAMVENSQCLAWDLNLEHWNHRLSVLATRPPPPVLGVNWLMMIMVISLFLCVVIMFHCLMQVKWKEEVHQVQHYHYKKWPDHGIPSEAYSIAEMLIHFQTHHSEGTFPFFQASSLPGLLFLSRRLTMHRTY